MGGWTGNAAFVPAPSPVAWYAAPETPLGAGELAERIGAAMVLQPKLEAAFRQLLAERLASATVASVDGRLSEREAGIAAGRLAEIMSLQGELAKCRRMAEEIRPQRVER